MRERRGKTQKRRSAAALSRQAARAPCGRLRHLQALHLIVPPLVGHTLRRARSLVRLAGLVHRSRAGRERSPSDGKYPSDAPAPSAPKPPLDLCCPITKELFVDPVNAADGEVYERAAIERHIRDKQKMLRDAQQELEDTNGESERAQRALANGITSPMGHGIFEHTGLVPARMAKRLADEWREENGK